MGSVSHLVVVGGLMLVDTMNSGFVIVNFSYNEILILVVQVGLEYDLKLLCFLCCCHSIFFIFRAISELTKITRIFRFYMIELLFLYFAKSFKLLLYCCCALFFYQL